MSVKFTDEQIKVINSRNCNLLVSAAAGSGKTAVLVERIIRLILEDQIDIDRILVVTFTEAAAKEMKERIGEAINSRLDADPLNQHLQKQSALLNKAQISTIHSFCLNVIRNNFNDIDLDPAFRVADEIELSLISEDILTGIFEDKLSQKDERFIKCIDTFTNGTNDRALRDYILKLSEYACGNPNPDKWLRDSIKIYDTKSKEAYDDSKYLEYIMKNHATKVLNDVSKMAQKALEIVDSPEGPSQYRENITDDIAYIEELSCLKSYDELRDKIASFAYTALSRKKVTGVDETLKEAVKTLRNDYKELINGNKSFSLKQIMLHSIDDEVMYLNSMSGLMHTLIELCIEYNDCFVKEKLKRGIISFSDMEHYALKILCTVDDNNNYTETEVAKEYQLAFDEILMDEYQDCNKVQELLIDVISGKNIGKFNRFMVGDVKQSIYKFRLSSPELFIEKYKSYRIDDSDGQCVNFKRIDLHKNFRSRENVIKTVNDLFGQIMHESLGNVEYDKDAHLVLGGNYPELDEANLNNNSHTELLLGVQNNDSELERNILEARIVAQRIKSLMKYQQVTDKATNKLRKLSYKDIAILIRSTTDVAEGIREVFLDEGIPFYLPMKNGFYDTYEIQQIIQLLKVINNPLADVEVYGALKSHFGGFTDEEIVNLRLNSSDRDLPIYLQLREQKDDAKIAAFLNFIEEYRLKSTYMPIHELISEIVVTTNFVNIVAAMAGGRIRKANINLLIMKAVAFEKTSFKGLFHFIRYIKELRSREIDEGEADILGEGEDVVRIMTIHKSKGLEFPVCFVCGIHKQFNENDIKGDIIVDSDFGVIAPYIDIDKRIKINTLSKYIIANKMRQEMIGEELRILYVAMTRAKEKLIISGIVHESEKESFEDKVNKYFVLHKTNEAVLFSELVKANSYYDFLKPLMNKAKLIREVDLDEGALMEAVDRLSLKGILQKKLLENEAYGEEYSELVCRTDREYSHSDLKDLFLKTSVSEIKKKYLDFTDTKELIDNKIDDPDSSNSELEDKITSDTANDSLYTISATDRGNAYHKVMELLDFSDVDIKSQINKFVDEKLISSEWAKAVSINKIAKFMTSSLAKRMAVAQKCNQLKREQPFVLGIKASDIYGKYPKGETVLLQGIIDAFFVEDGEIVLVDYKTDRIDKPDDLMNRYRIQLEYYEKAIEQILGYKVKESILYSFCLGEEVKK